MLLVFIAYAILRISVVCLYVC